MSAAGPGCPAMRFLFVLRCGAHPAPSTDGPLPTALCRPVKRSGSASGSQTDFCPAPEDTPACPANRLPPKAVPCLWVWPKYHRSHSRSAASVPPAHSSDRFFLHPYRPRTDAACCCSPKAHRSVWRPCIPYRSSLPAPARRGAPGGTARSGPAICPGNPGSAVPGSAPTATVRPSAAEHPGVLQTVPVHRSHPRGRTRCAAPPAAAAAWRRPAWASRPQGPHTRVHGAVRRSARLPAQCSPVSAPGPTVLAAG